MNYEFPHITHIDQVREAIHGLDEFFVSPRDGFYVANYRINFEETFPTPASKDAVRNTHYMIRRECRGIKFASKTGQIIARPFHKFFNINEKLETRADRVDFSRNFVLLEKLDGSMVHSMMLNGKIVWCTKMGLTDTAFIAQQYIETRPEFQNLAEICHENGYTPIFEWCSRKTRVVIDYPVDQLYLVAIRNMEYGDYLPLHSVKSYARQAAYSPIQIVPEFDSSFSGINEFIETVQQIKGREGCVIRFDGGHMLKLKALDYLLLHKIKENLGQEKNVILMIINKTSDDAKAIMEPDDQTRLDSFAKQFWANVDDLAEIVKWVVIEGKDNLNESKKRFAAQILEHQPKFMHSILFKVWDGSDAKETIVDFIKKSCSSGPKVDEHRQLFGGILWSDYYMATVESVDIATN